ncbi:MAG: NotI family restriction endonuclease, partial [Phycisphaerae bacterium]
QATLGDPMHIHAYNLGSEGVSNRLALAMRLSTDAAGIARCLGLQANPNLELADILRQLEAKLSERTLFELR